MNLKNRIRISFSLEIIGGIIGGIILSYLHLKVGNYYIGILQFMIWGICLFFGSKTRDYFRKYIDKRNIRIAPSWSNSLILCILSTFILFKLSKIDSLNNWTYFLLSINISYLGAKIKCHINHCCNVNFENRNVYFLKSVRLPLFEIYCTSLIILLISLLLIVGDYINFATVISIFLLHIVLRYYCSLLRFAKRKLNSFLYDYTILVPTLIFVVVININL